MAAIAGLETVMADGELWETEMAVIAGLETMTTGRESGMGPGAPVPQFHNHRSSPPIIRR